MAETIRTIPTKAQLMERLADSFSGYYGDFSVAAADAGLSASQAKTLGVLRTAPASMRALATVLACDASNITGIVDRLEKRDLVRREVSPSDRRVKNVVLTTAGEETVDAIRARMHTTHEALDALDDADRTALYDLLGRVFCGSRGPGTTT
ncbi:MarR family transcriptional regulator [Streptomyces agglomeratus]|uniref:MarR family transcriptional regulator n=1 Tax=Streptomyces agglomeratus TaxID=285458 RepID=A0A1E5P8F2_9ACTN|nr:MarR family transcriptional regulator [Streptomyces agglomeratus]OEJ25737.1 MarR family transcriptional regulator [Streptomyces agglomeratus]OEJ40221.1 MarR family transcriptional regulator [Streptomyces agglomeratus]OEJ45400.1 MarR family transcriptional regulator [Streptomyces agglomeratus]OEJ52771.1 MarR family transcriptional regulator [Streptomyces agglomeratus]OEJ60109.1 MarR family transcriptional regulator [Streptomyces agglomeratus]